MKFYRGFATVGAMTIMSRVLGFARDVLIAAVLGTSYAADAFFVAFRVPNMFRRLFAEGAFDAAFIPLFAKRLHADGPDAARAFAGQALSGLTVLLITFTVLAEIAMPWLMLLLAPGFRSDPEKFALAVMLARIALPYLAFMSLVALYTGVLNAFGRFAIAAFAPTLLNVVLIAVLLAFVASGSSNQSAAGVALAWGIAASGVLQVLVVAVAAAKLGMRLPWERPRLTPDTRRLVALAAPGIVAGGMAQLTVAMLAALALGLPAYVLIKVLHPSFFASEDTKTPMIFAGISMAANIVLSFTLFMALGATGIAIATMLSGWINVDAGRAQSHE